RATQTRSGIQSASSCCTQSAQRQLQETQPPALEPVVSTGGSLLAGVTSCTCHLDWRAPATAMERSPWHCPEHEISPLWSKRQRAPFASPSQTQAALVISTGGTLQPQ